MKEQIQQYKDKFEALSLRERGIVIVAVIGVLYMGWNTFLWQPVKKENQKQVKQIKKWHGQIEDIDKKISVVSTSMTKSEDADVMSRIDNLKSEIQNINAIKKDITVGFIRPAQMPEVLKGLLKKEPGLTLVRLDSLGAESLFPQKQAATEAEGSPKEGDTAKTTSMPSPKIYKHGVILEFKGDYKSTVSYLRNLESLPWKFYWDGVGYEVLEYPEALVTVNVFTLSLDKGWIGV